MKPRLRHLVTISIGLVVLAILLFFSKDQPFTEIISAKWVVIVLLLIFTTGLGIPIGSGEVSLTPMVSLISILVLGIVPSIWAEVISDLVYGLLRWFWPEKMGWEKETGLIELVSSSFANISMHSLSILAAGLIYTQLHGSYPVRSLSALGILISAGIGFIVTNYLTAAFFLGMRSKAHFLQLRQHISRMLLYELLPLVFAPLGAQVLTGLGLIAFIVFALLMILFASILRDQAKTHDNLQHRIQELSSLQAVGQTLSASLDIKVIAQTIYENVAYLMPVTNFYIALHNPDNDEVYFPLVYEQNELREWAPRATGKGLTEYLLKTRKPLLIEKNVKAAVEALGMEHYGHEAFSWLGVPILAGDQSIGVIAVQSYQSANTIPQSFTSAHQDILTTIAAQASIAIQNARLYALTDEALAQRVQELNSIMRTTSEGLMLLNSQLIVLQANPALAKLLNSPQTALLGQDLKTPTCEICAKIAFDPKHLDSLANNEVTTLRDKLFLGKSREIPVERTITPVRGEGDNIIAWLFVFRDLTEEQRLAQYREDFTRMLVHDLRSPIVSIQGGLDMIDIMLEDSKVEEIREMVNISRRGGEQMLGLINEILSLNKLESGQMILGIEPADLPTLFNEESIQFLSQYKPAGITLQTNFSRDLPIIQADSGLIKRVLHNLLDNAIKFTPDHGQIDIWAKPDPANKDCILFGIRDSGPGIQPDIVNTLFQKYISSQQSKARRRGTGLGLYFCRLAVEAHGGSIWLEDTGDQGSMFVFRLPVIPPKSIPAA